MNLSAPCSQDGTSEEFIGEWMETRKIRDQMVIATKARQKRKRENHNWFIRVFISEQDCDPLGGQSLSMKDGSYVEFYATLFGCGVRYA